MATTDVAKTGCPWRWPGQYEDEETGLFYNRFRYYDPGAGRYVSQDPIGLTGGVLLYGYVADPFAWVDPFGLSGDCGGKRFGESKLRGLIQNRPLRELTHHEIYQAFLNTPFKPTNHAIMRFKDIRTKKIGVNTLNDIAAILNKGIIDDAERGLVSVARWGAETVIDPISKRIVTFKPG